MVAAVVWFLVSAVFVDHAGYWLHRWAHRKSSGPMYRAHMTHHVVNYPPAAFFSQRYRSSRADSLAVWFAPFGLAYGGLWWLLGLPHLWAVLAGGGTVALLSSAVHDMTHISQSLVWRWRATMGMAVRHHSHHFKMGRNFGVLTDLWDRIFRTRRGPGASRPPLPRPHR